MKSYLHYPIEGYPYDIDRIVSDDGYGRNEYVETTRPLVVVTAPGPGSGKMATCLSQLFQELKHGVSAGYAKFETFPIWNLPLEHPVNVAYEAATVDLDDANAIDPFHLEAYGETTVNYNRDIEIFPVLKTMMEKILGESPYKSPTDMGVNMAGYAISDDEVCREASKHEIVRRYFKAREDFRRSGGNEVEVERLARLMTRVGVTENYSPAHLAALKKAEESGSPAGAIVLPDGKVMTGKTSTLLGRRIQCPSERNQVPSRHQRPRVRHLRRSAEAHLPSAHRAAWAHQPASSSGRNAHRAFHHVADQPAGRARS